MNVKIAISKPQIKQQTLAEKCIEPLCDTYDVITVSGARIGKNRNDCVNNGVSSAIVQTDFNFDRIIFVDTDIGFSFDHVEKLLKHNEPIVSGAYPMKGKDVLHAGYWNKAIEGWMGDCVSIFDTGNKEVDWCGGGFLMVDKSVFAKMKYPWFRTEDVNVGNCCEQTSDDWGFCINAKRAGFKILLDCDIVVEHKEMFL